MPEHGRLQELARDGLQPADQRLLHPDEPELREGDLRRGRRRIGRGGTGPVQRKDYKHPDSGGNLGEFLAMDVQDRARCCGAIARHRRPTPRRSRPPAASCSSATGIVTCTRTTRRTGKILWQTRLPTSAQGFPITYLANGKQYVAMPAGIGGGSWSTLILPELAPEIRRPNSGNVLLVFALPKT